MVVGVVNTGLPLRHTPVNGEEEGDYFICDTAECEVIFGEPVAVMRIFVVPNLETLTGTPFS